MNQARTLYRSTVGKKALLAVSGAGLLVFVFAHMLANLQIFAVFGGRAGLDGYARALHGAPLLLWGARAALAVCAATHLLIAAQLTGIKRAARPVPYRTRTDLRASVASRTMGVSGVVLALFVPIHLANLTWGNLHPHFVALAAYQNVVSLLRLAPVSAFYLVAMLALGLHLGHGARSLFASLGMGASRGGARALRLLAQGVGLATVAGFVAVVVAVAVGLAR